MAVSKPGPLAADVRGGIGEEIFFRNQGGQVIRSKGTWEQADTDAQVAAREAFAAISQAWSGTLSHQERSSWRSYAVQHPRPNRWGDYNMTKPFPAFLRHNLRAYLEDEVLHFAQAPISAPLYAPKVLIAIQADGAIEVTGTLTPDVVGTYIPDGEYNDHPYWKGTPAAGTWYIWFDGSAWVLSIGIHTWGSAYWSRSQPCGLDLLPSGEATGVAGTGWSYDASLAAVTYPCPNYPTDPEDLRIYLRSGKPINAGVSYYNGPWIRVVTHSAPVPMTAETTWLRWTWPLHAVGAPYTWPGDGTGYILAQAVAQAMTFGELSGPVTLQPSIGSLAPW